VTEKQDRRCVSVCRGAISWCVCRLAHTKYSIEYGQTLHFVVQGELLCWGVADVNGVTLMGTTTLITLNSHFAVNQTTLLTYHHEVLFQAHYQRGVIKSNRGHGTVRQDFLPPPLIQPSSRWGGTAQSGILTRFPPTCGLCRPLPPSPTRASGASGTGHEPVPPPLRYTDFSTHTLSFKACTSLAHHQIPHQRHTSLNSST